MRRARAPTLQTSSPVGTGPVIVIGGALKSSSGLVDLGEAAHDPTLPAFNLTGVRLSYLGRGDHHDAASGVTTLAARKLREPRIDPQRPV